MEGSVVVCVCVLLHSRAFMHTCHYLGVLIDWGECILKIDLRSGKKVIHPGLDIPPHSSSSDSSSSNSPRDEMAERTEGGRIKDSEQLRALLAQALASPEMRKDLKELLGIAENDEGENSNQRTQNNVKNIFTDEVTTLEEDDP